VPTDVAQQALHVAITLKPEVEGISPDEGLSRKLRAEIERQVLARKSPRQPSP
jgi:hypothetical protein